jgi:1-deoxy-D-xylulose-5-phosphate reductoisomerase
VDRFLAKKINFPAIPKIVQKVMQRHARIANPDLNQIICADAWARQEALALAG